MNDFLTRFRILPLVVLVAIAAFAVRVGEAVVDVRDMTATALSAEETAAADETDAARMAVIQPAAGDDAKLPPPPASGTMGSDDIKALATDGPMPSVENQPKVSLPEATLPEIWADPASQAMSDSPEHMELLEDLAKRRQQLDAREKLLDTRAALLKATEKQIENKIAEMTDLKVQIEKLLGQQEAEEAEKVKSLVKIYEGMKPKDAAAIFDQMDMEVLLQVITKMNERKSAPVIAAMNTSKANELTVRMTEMKKLPDRKTGFMGANARMQGPVPTAAPAGSAPLPGLDALGNP